jgi:hypothetical protein
MTIFETIKFWWRVKKYNRRLLKQAKYGNKDPYDTTPEDVENWIRNNPFGVTREELNVSHMTRVTAPPVITFKEFENGNR